MDTNDAARKALIPLIFFGVLLLLVNCSEEVSGPENTAPVIDSVILDPDAIHPGADIVLTAVASDPDGDSITYRWSTYPAAGRFSDTAAQTCTLTVSPVLKGGMLLNVTLDVSDGKMITSLDTWISLITGEIVFGHVYFPDTRIPLPGAEVFIGQLIDTSSFKGFYSINHVPPGDRTIQAAKPGCDDYSADIHVEDTMDYDICMVCNELVVTAAGNVATFDGIPLEAVRVILLNNDSSETELSGVTDINGDFAIAAVPSGKRLFAIEDAGNLDYQIVGDTLETQVNEDSTIYLTGRIRRTVFVSEGINTPEEWILVDEDFWKRWKIDTSNQCYSYNSCDLPGLGKLTMANAVAIPLSAKQVSWTIDVSLVAAGCVIAYIIDGEVVNSVNIGLGTGDFILDREAETPGHDSPGHDFAVEFYVWGTQSQICGTVCLRHFTISYYQ